ncbi:leucine-rich repeat-containing protein 58 [Culicoides brevitarsis]|uniref:leucine-rich repeat-containing protein 58 n=1 Tax=Culicoides brevitarsis TaxID=469753 RepID=UPI00307BD8B6
MEVQYTSESSDSDSREEKTVDISHRNLSTNEAEDRLEHLYPKPIAFDDIENVFLHHNMLSHLPSGVMKFHNLKVLDISSNNLTSIPDQINQIPLVTFIAKNNKLTNESLPKILFAQSRNIKEINLSGNRFEHFPQQLLDLRSLKYLYLGGNQIATLPPRISKMQSLQLLSLSGNHLIDVPETVGRLKNLQALVLADNLIERLPPSIANLKKLSSLLLHKNRLRTLPREIISLKNLNELSLRDNPLVKRFVQDMTLNPPSLLELAGRAVRFSGLKPSAADIPWTLVEYLSCANCCVNPKCRGVYFDNRVEHIKFVDFCGKYRVPLLQYLCSSKCIEDASLPDPHAYSSSDEEPEASSYMMRKVLLG